MKTIARTIDAAHTEVNSRTGRVRAIISDDSSDRLRTVFDPFGAKWDGFMAANGPILYEHGLEARGNLPVGNAVNLERGKFKGRNVIVCDTEFWDTDEFARTIKDAYQSQRMKAWSIRAMASESSPPTAAERRARSDWAEATTVYRAWDLLEVSTVSMPGNPNCTTTEVMRALTGPNQAANIEAFVRAYQAMSDKAIVRTRETLQALIARGASNAELIAAIQRIELELKLEMRETQMGNRVDRRKKYAEYEASQSLDSITNAALRSRRY